MGLGFPGGVVPRGPELAHGVGVRSVDAIDRGVPARSEKGHEREPRNGRVRLVSPEEDRDVVHGKVAALLASMSDLVLENSLRAMRAAQSAGGYGGHDGFCNDSFYICEFHNGLLTTHE